MDELNTTKPVEAVPEAKTESYDDIRNDINKLTEGSDEKANLEQGKNPDDEMLKADLSKLESENFKEELKIDLAGDGGQTEDKKEMGADPFYNGIRSEIEQLTVSESQQADQDKLSGDEFAQTEAADNKPQDGITDVKKDEAHSREVSSETVDQEERSDSSAGIETKDPLEQIQEINDRLVDLQEKVLGIENKFNQLNEAFINEHCQCIDDFKELQGADTQLVEKHEAFLTDIQPNQKEVNNEFKEIRERIGDLISDNTENSNQLIQTREAISQKAEQDLAAFQNECAEKQGVVGSIVDQFWDWNDNSALANLPEQEFARTMEDLTGVQKWIEEQGYTKEYLWDMGKDVTKYGIGLTATGLSGGNVEVGVAAMEGWDAFTKVVETAELIADKNRRNS